MLTDSNFKLEKSASIASDLESFTLTFLINPSDLIKLYVSSQFPFSEKILMFFNSISKKVTQPVNPLISEPTLSTLELSINSIDQLFKIPFFKINLLVSLFLIKVIFLLILSK